MKASDWHELKVLKVGDKYVVPDIIAAGGYSAAYYYAKTLGRKYICHSRAKDEHGNRLFTVERTK
jgi:hypothetical protein